MRMAQGELNYVCLEDNHLGLLSPEDVYLFYYDIGVDSEMGHSFIYSWNNDVEAFIKGEKLVIDSCDATIIPSSFNENEIFFTIGDEDEGNKAVAFFRHLRNAFSHYHIGLSGEYFCMKDFRKDGVTVTMIGKIHRMLFKELIYVFLMQKAKTEEEMNNNYYPNI